MFADTKAYSGLAVTDIEKARRFFSETLGVRTFEEYGLIWLHPAASRPKIHGNGSPSEGETYRSSRRGSGRRSTEEPVRTVRALGVRARAGHAGAQLRRPRTHV